MEAGVSEIRLYTVIMNVGSGGVVWLKLHASDPGKARTKAVWDYCNSLGQEPYSIRDALQKIFVLDVLEGDRDLPAGNFSHSRYAHWIRSQPGPSAWEMIKDLLPRIPQGKKEWRPE